MIETGHLGHSFAVKSKSADGFAKNSERLENILLVNLLGEGDQRSDSMVNDLWILDREEKNGTRKESGMQVQQRHLKDRYADPAF